MDEHASENPSTSNPSSDPVDFWFEPPIFVGGLFSDVMYTLSGQTQADNYRHALTRDAFMSLFIPHALGLPCVQTAVTRIGLPAIAEDIAGFLDRVAQRRGIQRRGDLALELPQDSRDTYVDDLVPEWHELRENLYATYNRFSEVLEVACMYVHDELKQQWLWLALEWTHQVFFKAWEHAVGVTMQVRKHHKYYLRGPFVEPTEVAVKEIKIKIGPGQTKEAAKNHIISIVSD